MKFKINWRKFFGVLLAPAVVSLLASATGADPVAVLAGLLGSAGAGIACGVMLANGSDATPAKKVLLRIVFSIVFGVLSLLLSFFGCAVGGFTLDVR